MRLDEIDKNLKVDKTIDKKGLKFFSFEEEPFRIYGNLMREEDDRLHRVPTVVARETNDGVLALSTNTAGGRVRFKTDSKRIAVIAKYSVHSKIATWSHFAPTGYAGLDLFEGKNFLGCFVPPHDMPNKAYESVITLGGDRCERELTIHLPIYADLSDLYIGIDEDATLGAAEPYKYEKPIVYYGSSITQGGCASRPGSTYQAILSRWLECDHINLGFSGSARGEDAIVQYMASLDMGVFVCDYNYNAPTKEHLEATHLPLYRKIREKHPEIPFIIMERPNSTLNPKDKEYRGAVLRKTYETAISEGDKNVYFLDPSADFPFFGDEATVDGVHPTDLGFYFMAKALYPILKEILKK